MLKKEHYVVQCPKCERIFVHKKNDYFNCRFCKKRIKMFKPKAQVKIFFKGSQKQCRNYIKQMNPDAEIKKYFSKK